MKKIDFKEIEKKWQDRWEKERLFEVKEEKNRKKFVLVEMWPYPSGEGLHMGHAFNYTIGDVLTRFKRMEDFNVFHPIGFDSLGLPAENAAIKAKSHPRVYTEKAIKNFTKQLKTLGFSYDWSRVQAAHDPNYYRWDQWIFLKMLERGLAYKKEAAVNWCPECRTVLANEQVHNGKCWKHEDTDVEQKILNQWFFKITKYANELVDNIDSLDYPERIKIMQKNWIGKSYGAEINFEINGENWPVFTTRPDTIFGVTFMVVSAQHSGLMRLVTSNQKKEVEKFLKKIKSVSRKEMGNLEKEGVFTGSYAKHPFTKEKIPIYLANFVLADYGSGMVMGVPAHDKRDFDFARKYKISIKIVIHPDNFSGKEITSVYSAEGRLVNSEGFSGLITREAREHIITALKEKGLGRKTVHYKLRDWLVSRQRFWGAPIPIVYCDKCGIVPVEEKDLPVKLPEKIKFTSARNPLVNYDPFVKTKCPKCNGKARRETDTMDTFVNSSWYFLRYCDPKNDKKIFDSKKVKYWMPMDFYLGGAEHACMHLIYYRFYTKFLRDIGLLDFDEPTKKLFNQGMLYGEDGSVMSKSRGNVVDPLDIVKKYSSDILRLYLVSSANLDKDFPWNEKTISSSSKFLDRIYLSFSELKIKKSSKKVEDKINRMIKNVTTFIDSLKYNLAVIELRQFFELLLYEKGISRKDFESFLKLLHPFCPHITEELWERLGNKTFLSLEKWPKADENKIDENLEKQEKTIEKLVEDINQVQRIIISKKKKVKKAYVYTMPNEKEIYEGEVESVERKTNLSVEVFFVNDKNKYDPQNKSKKAKPGKPAIYLE